MPTHLPTAEQEAIFSAALTSQISIMINAFAGCGKSSTLEMLSGMLPQTSACALAFNVKIKKELERRLPSWFAVKTFNGLGHAAWGRAIGKRCEVDDRKISKLLTSMLKTSKLPLSQDSFTSILNLVKKARHAGLVPKPFPQPGLIPDTLESWDSLAEIELVEQEYKLAKALLIESIKQGHNGLIDYDDQIYLSALFGGTFPRFSLVLVDEAQDLSPLNHIQVSRVAGPDGRLMVVGDPLQAIYAFRGADHTSMDSLKALRKEWITLPLTMTFRCPKAIVDRQQTHAKGFRAALAAPQGEVLPWAFSSENKDWKWSDVEEVAGEAQIAVLCRNNGPLISLAFKLIRQQVGCSVLGRDIGKGLVALAKKILKPETPLEACFPLINDWMERERALAEANDKPEKVARITDQGESLLAVLEGARLETAKDLFSSIESLFNKEGGVTLSSIHRSKGLEWPVVLHLDPWRIPSRWAKRDPTQMQQELNLIYVCETRAKRALILASLKDFQEN